MRPSPRWTYRLRRSTGLWLSGVACGVLALGGIGVIFSSPAWAPPFPPSPHCGQYLRRQYDRRRDRGGGLFDWRVV